MDTNETRQEPLEMLLRYLEYGKKQMDIYDDRCKGHSSLDSNYSLSFKMYIIYSLFSISMFNFSWPSLNRVRVLLIIVFPACGLQISTTKINCYTQSNLQSGFFYSKLKRTLEHLFSFDIITSHTL